MIENNNMKFNPILDNIKITGISADSRQVKSGYLFAAIDGVKSNGEDYITQAIDNGAIAILASKKIKQDIIGDDITLLIDQNPRRKLAKIAANFYGQQPDNIVAITGTNGKTSIAEFTRQLWQGLDIPSASIGTLGINSSVYSSISTLSKHGLTTPDPVEIHKILRSLKYNKINHVAMEASSHGLDMYRLDGVNFTACAFSNLSLDHLDYHKNMNDYLMAKMRLFSDLLPINGIMVINKGCDQYEYLANIAAKRNQRIISYGLNHGDIYCVEHKINTNGFSLKVSIFNNIFHVGFPLFGKFQIENALCAIGLVIACGGEAKDIVPLLSNLKSVTGRMQYIASKQNNAAIYVDFAHTPDALKTILTTIKPHVKGKLYLVFGCGGDRDQSKRQIMGEIASKYADIAIVSDDNPRNENAAEIRKSIMDGCKNAMEIGDRKQAIEYACGSLKTDDILIIAGKGHEQGQIIKDKILPFDDGKIVKEFLEKIIKKEIKEHGK